MEFGIKNREADCSVGQCVVLDLDGELDTYSCPGLRDTIIRLVDEGEKHILLNMGGVQYIDSAGLGTLVGGLKRATEHGGQLKIVNANDQIQKVFNITGLVRVFEQYKDEATALASFGTPEEKG
jgi:anti-sigma B factor antagonist